MEGEGDFFYRVSKGVEFTYSNSFSRKLYMLTLLTTWTRAPFGPSGLARIMGGAQGVVAPES